MPLEQRQAAMREIEKRRGGRQLIAICNLDRPADFNLPGTSTSFQEDMKEPLFRVLKETLKGAARLDVLLYTRGGATSAVWPIVSLLREFDPDFEVLVPFRAHSSGTMLALAANKVVMTPLAELSPIDPTTANQYNPRDPANQQASLGIAVEDVTSYRELWESVFTVREGMTADQRNALLQEHLIRLSTEIHPLALGNVHRVYQQIRLLAKMLLQIHYDEDDNIAQIIDSLTKDYYSHNHMINRHEARRILGDNHVEFADGELSVAMDSLLRQYEDTFEMRHSFFVGRYLGDEHEKEARLIGGVIESGEWSYLYETVLKVRQYISPPSGVQIQVPPGVLAPFVPGLPRKYEWQVLEPGWSRNTSPKGVTV